MELRMKSTSFLFPVCVLLLMTAVGVTFAEEWLFECQRSEIAPHNWIDNDVQYEGKATLALSGDGDNRCNGRWVRDFAAESSGYYRFRACYSAENVDEPHRCILARVVWKDREKRLVGRPEYPLTRRGKGSEDWSVIEQLYERPDGAVSADIELVFRWDGDGVVRFGAVSFEHEKEPEPRKVRLATVHFRPRDTGSGRENLDQFAVRVAEAGEKKADIVLLPESITLVGTGQDYVQASEPIPGPSTRFLGQLSKKYKMYIVAGLSERDGETVFNTAVLMGRDGELVGKYRKVCLPREEIEGGVTPGDEIPVFDTDFGRIGLMICWDVFFPEPARLLALQGAEVILMPIWGGNFDLAQARAIENQVYLITSTYDTESMKTGVFDREGKLLAMGSDTEQVVIVDIDLNERELWPWLGDFHNRIPRELPSNRVISTYFSWYNR